MAQTVRWFDAYVYPAIGDMQLDEAMPGHVLAIINARAPTAVTAEHIRAIVQQICKHAIRSPLVTMNSAQLLRGAVAREPFEHCRHLSEKELGEPWRKLEVPGAHATPLAASKQLKFTRC
ncbi:MAG: phage integrase central domain-containing protein [Rhizobacter sp.]